MMLRLYMWIRKEISILTHFLGGDYEDGEERDRRLMFIIAPLMVPFIQFLILYAIQFVVGWTLTLSRGARWEDAVRTANGWIDAFGVPLAALSLLVVMSAVSSRRVIRSDGGFHVLPADWGGWSRGRRARELFVRVASGILIGLALFLLLNLVAAVIQRLTGFAPGASDTTDAVTKRLRDGTLFSSPFAAVSGVITLAFSMVLSPVVEELFFRGFVGRMLAESGFMRGGDRTRPRGLVGTILVCLLSGLWFGIGHASAGDPAPRMLFVVLWITFMGAVFTALGSTNDRVGLVVTMAAHASYNMATLAAVLIQPTAATMTAHAAAIAPIVGALRPILHGIMLI